MVTKQKHFLDSLRQMVSRSPDEICPNCKKPHEGDLCPENDDGIGAEISESTDQPIGTAFLVDLVSNHKIKIPVPTCQIGRDETNDIVVSGDQSISRHHLNLICEGNQYYLEDNSSRHGTFLNGTQIKSREAINDGDVIKIGVSLFWFVVEGINGNENGPATNPESGSQITDISKISAGEPAHLKVGSDLQSEASDPSSSTMNEIPVMPSEQTLLERLRMKTHSFDQAGLFTSGQSQMSTMPPIKKSGPANSVDDTQSSIPAMGLNPLSDEPSKLMESLPSPQAKFDSSPDERQSPPPPPQELNMSPQDSTKGATVYDQFMSTDLAVLVNKYNALKEQIERAEKERQEIADQLNTIRELGTGLIGGSDRQLIESCYKVLSKLGWQISLNAHDSQELQLKAGDHLSIARVIWTTAEPERSHLGQLSISQTQQWCDQGEEPKGILIVSRLGTKAIEAPSLTKADYDSELAKHAAKKNVCMMTSIQVLAMYRDLVLKHLDVNTLREKIINCAGWLEGFDIKTH
jgi:hypothetical protein